MAGSVEVAHVINGNIRQIVCTVVADAVDGSVPAVALPSIEGRLLTLETTPGSTQPTSGYDVEVFDENGIDLLEDVGLNRSATVSEIAPIFYPTTQRHAIVDDTNILTLRISNNLVPGAQATIALRYGLGV